MGCRNLDCACHKQLLIALNFSARGSGSFDVRAVHGRRELRCRRHVRQSVNRVLKFVTAKYGGVVPKAGETGELERSLAAELTRHLANLKSHQDVRSLRKVANEVRAIWSAANAHLAGC
jgi:methionyl-tRNA synthetase